MTTPTSTTAELRPVILHAAAALFRERGYAETVLRDIAQAVGIKAGSIYYHFPSKERIAIEVLKEGIRVVYVAVEQALAALPKKADPIERLRVAMKAHLSALLEEGVFTSAHIRIFSYVPAEIRAEGLAARTAYDKLWRDLIDGLARSGKMRPDVDPALFRLALLGALNWSLEWYAPGSRPPDEIAGQWFTLFTAGVLKD